MKKINHPDIMRLVEVIDDPDCPKLYCFTELFEAGELMHWVSEEKLFLPNPQLIRVMKKDRFERTSIDFFEEE